MSTQRGRTWKLERASVQRKARTQSNKYSSGDSHARPGAGTRKQVWVGGYTRADGTSVKGHYRFIGN
jgi:hypothetical protein